MTEVLMAVSLALLIRLLVFEPVRVQGRSMMDTLRDREVMLVTKYDYLLGQPGRFDVVTCRYHNRRQTFVKRIVGLPGDTLTIQDGVLSVNGVPCPEPHITAPAIRWRLIPFRRGIIMCWGTTAAIPTTAIWWGR